MSFISTSSSSCTDNGSSFSDSSVIERSNLNASYLRKSDTDMDTVKSHPDELDSVFPDEIPQVRREEEVGEDISDAIWKAKFSVSK